MERHSSLIFILCCLLAFVPSCEKAPLLVINTPSSISFSEQGGTQKVSFTANRDWAVSSSESWCKVSPSSGLKSDGELFFTVACDPNMTYDSRNATVTIKAEELMETISVTQDTNLGMLVTQTSYNISSAEQTIEIEVKSNVNYVVDIPSDCKDWISHISTKSLTTRTLVLRISENKAYDDRTGYVTVRQTDGPLAETITFNQKQADGIVVPISEYRVSRESQNIEIEIESNVDYDVIPEVDWIHYIETKALSSSSIILSIDDNSVLSERRGFVRYKQKNGPIEGTVLIIQEPDLAINFEDINTKMLCVMNWDYNGDGELSLSEANRVTSLDNVFYRSHISSFNELRYFLNLESINSQAFSFSTIESISLPDKLLRIGSYAFQHCSNISKITIPSGVSYIGEYAFYYCSRISSINIPQSLTTIEQGVFSDCRNLSYVSIPNGVNSIGGSAFQSTSLTTILIPESVSYIGEYAFANTSLLSVSIPKSVSYIVGNPFLNCKGLIRIDVDSNNSVYDSRDNCNAVVLTAANTLIVGCKNTTIPNTIRTIGEGAFSGSPLVTVIIPDSVESIENYAFDGCDDLSTITLSKNLRNIGNGAFRCKNLKSITIPQFVESIGSGVFIRCYDLSSLTVEALNPPTVSGRLFEYIDKENIHGYNINQNLIIYVPSESIEAYKTAQYWGDFADRIKAIPSPSLLIPEAVDLGLSVRWASFNLGATMPEAFGEYYAWGETEPKTDYSWATYKWCDGSDHTLTKYNDMSTFGTVDNKTVLEPEDDAAHVILGGNWRMPTEEEWYELREKCSWSWSWIKHGMIVTAPNGNSIILPSPGHKTNQSSYQVGSNGFYWTSTLSTPSGPYAESGQIDDDYFGSFYCNRFRGQSIRPVTE